MSHGDSAKGGQECRQDGDDELYDGLPLIHSLLTSFLVLVNLVLRELLDLDTLQELLHTGA